MNRPACQAARKDGERCRAPALPGSHLCWSHDPGQADAAARARAEGASKGGKLRALHGRRRKLDTHAGLAQFVTNLVHDVVEGKQAPDTARVALYGCSILRQLAEHSVEKRLAEMERLLAQGGAGQFTMIDLNRLSLPQLEAYEEIIRVGQAREDGATG